MKVKILTGLLLVIILPLTGCVAPSPPREYETSFDVPHNTIETIFVYTEAGGSIEGCFTAQGESSLFGFWIDDSVGHKVYDIVSWGEGYSCTYGCVHCFMLRCQTSGYYVLCFDNSDFDESMSVELQYVVH